MASRSSRSSNVSRSSSKVVPMAVFAMALAAMEFCRRHMFIRGNPSPAAPSPPDQSSISSGGSIGGGLPSPTAAVGAPVFDPTPEPSPHQSCSSSGGSGGLAPSPTAAVGAYSSPPVFDPTPEPSPHQSCSSSGGSRGLAPSPTAAVGAFSSLPVLDASASFSFCGGGSGSGSGSASSILPPPQVETFDFRRGGEFDSFNLNIKVSVPSSHLTATFAQELEPAQVEAMAEADVAEISSLQKARMYKLFHQSSRIAELFLQLDSTDKTRFLTNGEKE